MVVRPNVVLAICCTSILVVSLDATLMNVALPAIRADLGAKTSGLQWVLAGLASAISSTSRQVGASFGIALAGAIVSGTNHHVSPTDFVESSHAFWWVVAIAGVVIAGLGILARGERARASVAGIAALLVEAP